MTRCLGTWSKPQNEISALEASRHSRDSSNFLLCFQALEELALCAFVLLVILDFPLAWDSSDPTASCWTDFFSPARPAKWDLCRGCYSLSEPRVVWFGCLHCGGCWRMGELEGWLKEKKYVFNISLEFKIKFR